MENFILTEVETGMTFASLALNSATEEKRRRTRQNGRKAYDTAMHFWTKYPSPDATLQSSLHARLTELRGLLLQLGETFKE